MPIDESTLISFLKTGELAGLRTGTKIKEVLEYLGQPEGYEHLSGEEVLAEIQKGILQDQQNYLILDFKCLQLTFWTQNLTLITISIRPFRFKPLGFPIILGNSLGQDIEGLDKSRLLEVIKENQLESYRVFSGVESVNSKTTIVWLPAASVQIGYGLESGIEKLIYISNTFAN